MLYVTCILFLTRLSNAFYPTDLYYAIRDIDRGFELLIGDGASAVVMPTYPRSALYKSLVFRVGENIIRLKLNELPNLDIEAISAELLSRSLGFKKAYLSRGSLASFNSNKLSLIISALRYSRGVPTAKKVAGFGCSVSWGNSSAYLSELRRGWIINVLTCGKRSYYIRAFLRPLGNQDMTCASFATSPHFLDVIGLCADVNFFEWKRYENSFHGTESLLAESYPEPVILSMIDFPKPSLFRRMTSAICSRATCKVACATSSFCLIMMLVINLNLRPSSPLVLSTD